MITSLSAPNKASEDVKPGVQTHASGTGHHMKTVAKKCKYFIFTNYLRSQLLFCIFKGLNQN
jgi:hypothetical protein